MTVSEPKKSGLGIIGSDAWVSYAGKGEMLGIFCIKRLKFLIFSVFVLYRKIGQSQQRKRR